LVLAETLDEDALQILLDLYLTDTFPKQCNEWRDAKRDISNMLAREWTKRQRTGFKELASQENTLRRVLRDAIIDEVMDLFPCVSFGKVSSCGMLRP
jgi:hypothetical protein